MQRKELIERLDTLRNLTRCFLAGMAFLLLSACSDPYEDRLSASGFVTAGQAEELARNLAPEDKEMFKRWAARMATSERFPGEEMPLSIRLALMNQTRYETMKSDEKSKEEAKRAQEQQAVEAERRESEESFKRLKTTDAAIKTYLVVTGDSYDIVPIFNSYGSLAYREWQFDLKLTNKTPKEIIGVRGAVLVKDAFGKELGMYNVRMEPTIAPGRTVTYRVVMRHDPNDIGHVAMLNTQTVFPEWFFDSLAFRDGSTIDESTIANAAAADNKEATAETAI